MHLLRILLILVIVAISSATTQCKTIVMDAHMKKCKLGVRAKRSLERHDLLKHDEKLKIKTNFDYPKMDDDSDSYRIPQKRQLSPEVASYIALPIVTEALNGAAKARTFSSRRYEERDSSLRENHFIRNQQESYPLAPSNLFTSPVFYPAFDYDLSPYLNTVELDELYNDIYKRLPRTSKEEAWKAFLETAARCCRNVDMCLKEAIPIPCLTF